MSNNSKWDEFFLECGIDPTKVQTTPPLGVEYYICANRAEDRAVMIVFKSGDMASGLVFPAEEIPTLIERLKHNAERAQEI